jgi:hypothetical protein
VRAELVAQELLDAAGGHRRRRLLQPRQGRPVGAHDVLRQRRFQHRQRLPDLHRPALQLTEHLEELLGGALLEFERDLLGGPAADAFAHAEGGPARDAEGESGELGGPRDGASGQFGHRAILSWGM